jgi:hypothetical protein
MLFVGLYTFRPATEQTLSPTSLAKNVYNVDDKLNYSNQSSIEPYNNVILEQILIDSILDYNSFSDQIAQNINDAITEDFQKLNIDQFFEPIYTGLPVNLPERPQYLAEVEVDKIAKKRDAVNIIALNYERLNRILERTSEHQLPENFSLDQSDLWRIADIGFEGISKLTGKSLILERSYNTSGELIHLALQTESFRISRDFR